MDLAKFQQQFNVLSMERNMPDLVQVDNGSIKQYHYLKGDITVKLEMTFDGFQDMVRATQELTDIETDPATAELIKEAKIIYRLKHGIDQNA